MGGDIDKKDVSEIDFFVDNEELEQYELYDWTIDEDRVKECFENWDQTILNTIERVKLYFEIETSSNCHETELSEYTVYIEIKLENNKKDFYWVTWKYDTSSGAYGYVTETSKNMKGFDDDYLSIESMIAYMYEKNYKK